MFDKIMVASEPEFEYFYHLILTVLYHTQNIIVQTLYNLLFVLQPFTGDYLGPSAKPGVYNCVCCGTELFR